MWFPNFTSSSPFPELVWPQSPDSHLSKSVTSDLVADSDAHSGPYSDPGRGLAAGCKGAVKYGVQPQLICVEHRPAKLQAAAQCEASTQSAAAGAETRAEAEQGVTNKAEAENLIYSGRIL